MNSNGPYAVVKRGSVQVKIYKLQVGGKSFYSVDWRMGGKRYRKAFTDSKEARRVAALKATQLSP